MSVCYDLHKLYKQGLERKRQRLLRKGKGFKLIWLPVLARNEVIRSMDINEIIKLSLSSRKMEGIVRYSKLKVKSIIEIRVSINDSILQIRSLIRYLKRWSPENENKELKNLYHQILSRLIDKNSSSFQNCVSVLKYLQNIISFKSLCLHVNFEDMTVELFKEILTEPALTDFEFLRLEKGEIDAECLDLVMEKANSKRWLQIMSTEIPEDYYHENVFKFKYHYYYVAEWVRIEHLFTLKDCYGVTLCAHRLNQTDLNTYIKFWIENDHDMVLHLALDMEERIQNEVLFDGIVVLQERRRVCLVLANPTKLRKQQILSITWKNEVIKLYSWSKDEPLYFKRSLNNETFETEYKTLMVLNKKKKLEEELQEIQNLLETNQDQTMVEKKNEISRELQIVSAEMDNYNLEFRNGVYNYM